MAYDQRDTRDQSSRNRGRRPPAENAAIADLESERFVLGYCLASRDTFWKLCDRLKPEDFFHVRHARIWTAMLACAEKQKAPIPNLVGLYIKGDKDEETPLQMFLQILKGDALGQDKTVSIETYINSIEELSQRRAIIAALETALIEARTAEPGTPAETIRTAGMNALTSTMSSGIGDRYMKTYAEHAETLAKRINEDLGRDEEDWTRGLHPGLKAVYEVIGPLLPGKVYVLGGLSGGGKTALAQSIMEAAAADAKRKGLGYVYNASFEMQGEEHASRFLAQELGLTSYKIERSEVSQAELERIATRGIEAARKLPIMIDRYPRMNMANIRTRMITLKHQRGLAMGIIDHLLLVKKGSTRESTNDHIMEVMIEAKLLAGELEIPMLVLSQVNERTVMESASMKPNASHLFGSQAIQQNADVTFFVHRPEIPFKKKGPANRGEEAMSKYETTLEKLIGKASVYNDKGRGHGGGNERDLFFNGPNISFSDV